MKGYGFQIDADIRQAVAGWNWDLDMPPKFDYLAFAKSDIWSRDNTGNVFTSIHALIEEAMGEVAIAAFRKGMELGAGVAIQEIRDGKFALSDLEAS